MKIGYGHVMILSSILLFGIYFNKAAAGEIKVLNKEVVLSTDQTYNDQKTLDTTGQMEGTENATDSKNTSTPDEAGEQVDVGEQDESKEQEELPSEEQQTTIYDGNIVLKKDKISLQQGDSYPLEVTLSEENLSNEVIQYKSSDNKIITVSKEGIIKAVHWGKAKVTINLGEAEAVCNITVDKDIKITISAAGDCTLSSDIKQPVSINFFSVYNKHKNDSYFFQNVKSIFEKDDMTIVNFEGTLSNRGSRVDKKWGFRGKPSYINILNKGSIEAVAFANNHVRDYGEVSYTDTINSFEKAGLIYSSYSKVGIYEVKGIKIGMISIQEVGVTKKNYVATLRNAFKAVNKQKPDLLIVSFHWGIERTSQITKEQKELSRLAIDEGGADLVLGHHPHVLQPIEKYKDSYIVYSLGNFCFGGNTNPPDKDTMIYQQTFQFHNDQLVPEDNVSIIPCSVSSISTRNNYQPTPSVGSEKKRILKKMNNYCKQFGISFDKNGKLVKKVDNKKENK
jgi:poly-gamma-glutamate synthesis protein (capsule biosynthesis protein)